MRSSAARGITLLEVIVGIALMGTLLAMITVSSSQHLRQLRAAEQKRKSVRALDDFLASWSVQNFSREGIPSAVKRSGLMVTGSYGNFGDDGNSALTSEGYRLRLRKTKSPDFDAGAVVRLTVTVPNRLQGRKPTVWAEVLVPQ